MDSPPGEGTKMLCAPSTHTPFSTRACKAGRVAAGGPLPATSGSAALRGAQRGLERPRTGWGGSGHSPGGLHRRAWLREAGAAAASFSQEVVLGARSGAHWAWHRSWVSDGGMPW